MPKSFNKPPRCRCKLSGRLQVEFLGLWLRVRFIARSRQSLDVSGRDIVDVELGLAAGIDVARIRTYSRFRWLGWDIGNTSRVQMLGLGHTGQQQVQMLGQGWHRSGMLPLASWVAILYTVIIVCLEMVKCFNSYSHTVCYFIGDQSSLSNFNHSHELHVGQLN